MDPVDGPNGQALWERMRAAIPGGGIYLTRSPRFAGRDVVPGFVRTAEGCRIVDADGRSYLDFNCGNGPNLLGYRHPEVDAAAAEQAGRMDLASFFPEVMPEYAERLLAWHAGFDWVVFAKNGSDTTNLALRIMRVATDRPLIVLFESAYHGFGAEIALEPDRSADAAQRDVVRVCWNDAGGLQRVARERGNDIAGVLVNPLDQNPAQETQGLSREMVAAIHRARDLTGCFVTLDDVRHGFRLHPHGSHVHVGLEPDLLCLGKALANGYSTAAVLGAAALRDAAERLQFTATFMFSAVALRAGIENLKVYERDRVFEHIEEMGTLLARGIVQAGRDAGHDDVRMSGPPTMPTFLFGNDERAKRARVFASHAARMGAIFHPRLNWFLSYAHKESDIEEAVDIARRAFAQTPARVEDL